MRFMNFSSVVLSACLSAASLSGAQTASSTPQTTASEVSPKVGALNAADVANLMPPTVFFQGKSAPVQMRNAAGVRFVGGGLLLTGLVDTSGYASEVQERYQAYLLLDRAVMIEGHTLTPGAYGIGFLRPQSFVVMDLSGHDLFVVDSHHDEELRRPTPLQVLPSNGASGEFRICAGRSFVSFSATAGH
jgi:hypothetical protein